MFRLVHEIIRRLLNRQVSDSSGLPAFPNLENTAYRFALQPAGSEVRAWSKLKECERRLAVYQWAVAVNGGAANRRVLLNDSVNAFLWSYEATIQFLKDQYELKHGKSTFMTWFSAQSHCDLHVKGLRTLRHFEAHVEAKPAGRKLVRVINESLGSGPPTRASGKDSWVLAQLDPVDLSKLRTPTLDSSELATWNSLVTNSDAGSVFEHGVDRLKHILEAAEPVM
jgi:hypothetical protein